MTPDGNYSAEKAPQSPASWLSAGQQRAQICASWVGSATSEGKSTLSAKGDIRIGTSLAFGTGNRTPSFFSYAPEVIFHGGTREASTKRCPRVSRGEPQGRSAVQQANEDAHRLHAWLGALCPGRHPGSRQTDLGGGTCAVRNCCPKESGSRRHAPLTRKYFCRQGGIPRAEAGRRDHRGSARGDQLDAQSPQGPAGCE